MRKNSCFWAQVLVSSLLAASAIAGQYPSNFPTQPDPRLTPGKYCHDSRNSRYPEKIAYCNRNVSTETKKEVIKTYDTTLGFKIGSMSRGEFKIDHYFPLCAGGSNDPENLWPQHQSVFEITDPLESEVCQKMSQGKLKQAEAIFYIIKAKNHLEEAPEVLRIVRSL